MRQLLNRRVFAGLVMTAVFWTQGTPRLQGEEGEYATREAQYKAAVQAAEARFQKSVQDAQQQLLRDLETARSLITPVQKKNEPAPAEDTKLVDLPVTVTGADPVPLIEATGTTGWSDISPAARGAAIFETRDSEPKDGVLQFSVTRDSLVGLAASWAYDGNASGGWQEDRKWKKDLTDNGWIEVGRMYHNLRDRHTLFVRQCMQGEEFGIRTRKYRRPYVFIPRVFDPSAKPVVAPQPKPRVEVIAAERHATAEFLPDGFPGELKGTTTFASPLAGVAIIRVNRQEQVYVAASWDYDGNSSGQWTEESWSKQKFRDEGWKELGKVDIRHRGSNQPHILFVRDCNKGERLRIRTRKYGAPYVFATITE